MKVCVFDIKRFAVHDGPGIRTTVFLKGCPLECLWCHNPEGISLGTERFTETFTFDGIGMQKDIEVGRWMDVTELIDELERDKIFMEESGGGISFSGGEPLQQPDALFRLLEMARGRNIHTAVDTSGHTAIGNIEKLSVMTDLILYDLKTMDEEKHRRFTGVSNRKILRNLERLQDGSAAVVIRIPVVSGFNEGAGETGAMLDFIRGLKGIQAVDILPYHPYGTHKYRRFMRENRQNGFKIPTKRQIQEIRNRFTDAGFTVKIGG